MPLGLRLEEVQEKYPRHNIEAKIDDGGQKEVFKGEFDGQDIVLKTLIAEDWEAAKRAELEVRAMRELDTPILVNLIQDFQDTLAGNELYVMVEDYIDGQTLYDTLNMEGPDLELGLDVGLTLLEALEDFDRGGFIHRDIKPKNIMIDKTGQIRLLDVGIARSPEDTDITPTGRNSAPGTPGRRAPEQLQNQKERQDTRTDIFALGITMFETITGVHPFKNQAVPVQEAVNNGIRDDLTEHISIPPEYEGLDVFLHRCLETKMHDRFNNPTDALERLELIAR